MGAIVPARTKQGRGHHGLTATVTAGATQRNAQVRKVSVSHPARVGADRRRPPRIGRTAKVGVMVSGAQTAADPLQAVFLSAVRASGLPPGWSRRWPRAAHRVRAPFRPGAGRSRGEPRSPWRQRDRMLDRQPRARQRRGGVQTRSGRVTMRWPAASSEARTARAVCTASGPSPWTQMLWIGLGRHCPSAVTMPPAASMR